MVLKGQIGLTTIYGLMLGTAIIVLILALAAPIKTFTDSARNETSLVGGDGLNCTNPALSMYDKGACQITDLTLPIFVMAVIFIAGIVITAKYIFQQP